LGRRRSFPVPTTLSMARLAAELLLLGLVSACSKSATSPTPEASAAIATSTRAPGPQPGDSNNPAYISLRFECAGPPLPVAAGQSPVSARLVSYEDFGLALPARDVSTTVRRKEGAPTYGSLTLEKAQRERLYQAAIAAFEGPPTEPERAVPDGEICQLELFRGALQFSTRVQLPTSNAQLRPLVSELGSLLPIAK